jgi:3-methyl-2-oxobutanoate hydroxymethyltransferase
MPAHLLAQTTKLTILLPNIMKRHTFPKIFEICKERKIKMLTSYTTNVARLTGEIADILLIGDSLGMVLYGFPSTHGVTIEMMELHTKAVAITAKKPLIIADLPFGTFEFCEKVAFQNACRLISAGACGVKIEGGTEIASTVKFLTERGIPVVGHVGLMPQKVHQIGGYEKILEKKQIIEDFQAVANAGAKMIVLENISSEIAKEITESFPNIITIGIGAGTNCKGHVAVFEVLINLSTATIPPFYSPIFDTKAQILTHIEEFFAKL